MRYCENGVSLMGNVQMRVLSVLEWEFWKYCATMKKWLQK